MYMYMYIYIYINVHMHINIYIHIYNMLCTSFSSTSVTGSTPNATIARAPSGAKLLAAGIPSFIRIPSGAERTCDAHDSDMFLYSAVEPDSPIVFFGTFRHVCHSG